MERPCDICRKNYIAPNAQSMFCSTECKRLGRNARLRRKTAEKLKTLQCVFCSKSFVQRSSQQTMYCDKICKQKAQYQKAKSEGKTTKKKLKELVTRSRLEQGKCANCEETDIRVFEFAHFSREDKTIRSVSQHQCLSDVREEFKKGRWLCVWCHRMETVSENKLIFGDSLSDQKRQKSKLYIDNIKLGLGGCLLCKREISRETVSFFEFDHIDPATKISTIANMVGLAREKIDAEISKCRLLCCRCHRLHTIEQMKIKYKTESDSEEDF